MRNKRILVLLGSVCLIFVLTGLLFMGACAKPAPAPPAPTPTPPVTPPPAPAKPIELTLAYYNAGATYDGVGGAWIEEVEKRTEGRVKITSLFGVVPPPEHYDAVIAGTADMSLLFIQLNPGRWPCLEVMQLCDFDMVCRRPARVAWELYKAFPEMQEGFAETKILAIMATVCSPPAIGLSTIKGKPVYKLEDMKGLKLMAPGPWYAKRVSALGASSVSFPPSQFYENLQRGIVDGVLPDPEHFKTYKIGEVLSYYTKVNMGFMPWWFSMNWNSWNNLPPDIQKIFEEVSGEYYVDEIVDPYFQEEVTPVLPWIEEEYGIELIEFPPEEMARWNEALKTVEDEYVAELEAKGLPGKKLVEDARRLYAEYAAD